MSSVKFSKKYTGLFIYIFSVFIIFIFSIFNFTNLKDDVFYHSQDGSDAIVRQTLVCQDKYGQNFLGSNIVLIKDSKLINSETCEKDNATPYASQLGIQAKITGAMQRTSSLSVDRYFVLAKIFSALTLAATLALFVLFVRKQFGTPQSIIVLIFILFSQWVLLFAQSVYWQEFLLFAPFIFTLLSYPKLNANKKISTILFYAVIFVLFSIKCLAGYEYLSTIVISIIVAVLYHELKKYGTINKQLLSSMVKKSLIIFFVCFFSFICALTIHFIQLNSYFHNSQTSKNAIITRINERTIGGESKFYYDALYNFKESAPAVYEQLNHYVHIDDMKQVAQINPQSVKYKVQLLSFINYSFLPVLQIPLVSQPLLASIFGSFIILYALVVLLAIHLIKKTNKSKLNSKNRSIYAASVCSIVSLAAPLSWLILSRGHAIVHPHINGILYYIPTLLFIYIIFAIYINRLYLKIVNK